jgi:hypothetical protein
MFAPVSAHDVVRRLNRAPDQYTWTDLRIGEHACLGVWRSDEETVERWPGGSLARRQATVLDFGFEAEAGLRELVWLIGAACGALAAQGVTHLLLYTSARSAGAGILSTLGACDEVLFRSTLTAPDDSGGLYTDPLYV